MGQRDNLSKNTIFQNGGNEDMMAVGRGTWGDLVKIQ